MLSHVLRTQKRIAIVMGLADAYEHGIARGIVRYAKAARLAALEVPVVDVASACSWPSFHLAANDDEATGRRAGDYLRACGFRRFAFCGVEGTGWSKGRREGFAQAVRSICPRVPVFEAPLGWWESLEESGRLRDWISRLERPVGVFACNDTAGLKLAEVCRSLSVPVRDSVAILGVGNEDILCEMASPSLSSIELDCETIGFRAAALLDRLTSGGRAPGCRAGPASAAPARKRIILVPPKEVVERESTRVFACADPLVERAVRAIRSRAAQGATAAAILAELPASRRSAEIRFRRATGRSVRQEIHHVRLALAKTLLRSTHLTVAAVAAECGFASAQRFHEAFRKGEGVSPGAFRKRQTRTPSR